MKILGFHNGFDAGAALIVNGKLIGAVNEERFNRQKLYEGFPEQSISFLLEEANISLVDIDIFAYGWFQGTNASQVMPNLVKRIGRCSNDIIALDIIEDRLRSEFDNDEKVLSQALAHLKERGIDQEKIHCFEHHKSHAWSAYAPSPFDEALVVTADGRGDYKSMTVSVANHDGISEIDWLSTLDSVGYLYSRITHLLGFKFFRHEGKITGLAAYGSSQKTKPIMKQMMSLEDGQIVSNLGEWFTPFPSNISKTISNALSGFSREDIAAGLQEHVEELVVGFIQQKLKSYPMKNICLAGGLFANVKLNQKIFEINGINNIYVQPHMGDGGIALGSAIIANFETSGSAKLCLPDVYLGSKYTDSPIRKTLETFPNVSYSCIENKAKIVCDLITNDKVVGHFSGKMEFGPRALGHRSILYHPCDRSVNDWLNKRMSRTEFMPFAPIIPIELAERCFVGWKSDHVAAQFMTLTYNCTDWFAQQCPAVTHIDGTARPQIVSKESDPEIHDILTEYFGRTGIPALINTSFNNHEEPIVEKPSDAVEVLLSKSIDALVIGNYVATTT